MTPRKILVGDDDINVIAGLKFLLETEGFQIQSVTTAEALLAMVKQQSFDVVLVDMNFRLDTTSGQEGLALIKQLRQLDEQLPIIMMTGWATVELAVDALKLGANDFLQKPWNDDRLLHAINSQIASAQKDQQLRCLSEENQLLKAQSTDPDKLPNSHSPSMQHCLSQLEQLAKSDMNVLLTGENGSGKSLLAQYVHGHSTRSEQRFVAVNMGALSGSLFESEMFGHVKGAFTDAKTSRVGRFELADGGTLFLDEIANIELSQQAKLLRVLEESQFEKVGSSKTQRSDARIISATNANLDQMIASNQFRQDLFYRLNTVTIHIPSLKERVEDITGLAQHFLSRAAAKYNKTAPALADDAIAALQSYQWPGNVRELSHLMERVLFTCTDPTISAVQLNLPNQANSASAPIKDDRELTLDEIEKNTLISRLTHFKGNASQTAKSLGLSRSGWYRRADKFDL
ncbi:MAG: sigma-54 dependent transcriptional regulator [Psychrosphaera sp.]|nr:sigma-54 dependent transcriptional regulator [Psychrosphaera sp.]